MSGQDGSKNKKQKQGKRKLLESFFTREVPDEDYLPELKAQWVSMNKAEQIKFILGAVVGLILILGGLILVFLIINSMMS